MKTKEQIAELRFSFKSLDKTLYLIGRGSTPGARRRSEMLRADMLDPEKRKSLLNRLREGREKSLIQAELNCSRPRLRGRWVKTKPQKGRPTIINYRAASKARWADPIFRERGLKQLAEARAFWRRKREQGK